ncbi:MAG: CBS domain-containing protein [Actinomycetota bacterium]|nr:CBS domain-containing protein [Actinomycetota bacterium]
MLAKDIMTTNVVTVTPDARVREIAQLLLKRHVSAVPVVDAENRVVGIVSEGDLMRRPETGTERHRSWWLTLVAGSEDLARDYAKAHGVRAADVMSGNVVTVTEDTPVGTIARLLEERHIKRVPVLRNDKLVGIVSRADLLRGLASRPAQPGVSPSTDDRAIRERLLQTLRTEPWAPTYLTVIVTDGMVHFWGVVSSEEERDALRVAANTVPGVRGVEDHLVEMTPWAGAE